jgi:Arc/MetJ family transcription regulator
VRTTVTLSDDVHARVVSVARDRHQTVSRTVEELVRRALGEQRPTYTMSRDPDTGFLGIDFGQPITAEDVRSLDDDA